jgi:hypothetical protein
MEEIMMKMRLFLSVILLLLVLIGCGKDDDKKEDREPAQTSEVVHDAEAILTVDAGLVEWQASGTTTWIAVSESQAITRDDRIRTDATGQAMLTFFTGTEAQILPNSELIVRSFEQSDTGDALITLEQVTGEALHSVNAALDSGLQYEVTTPVAQIVVRGTRFGVRVEDNGATHVEVQEGVVQAVVDQTTIELQPGTALDVDENRVPSTPYAIPTGPTLTPAPTISSIRPPATRVPATPTP